MRRVHDLGVELDAVQAALRVGDRGIGRRAGAGRRLEAGRQPLDRIAVAHPDRLLGLQTGEESIALGHRDDGRPELLAAEGHDLAAERLGHQVQAIADAQDRHAAGPERRVGMGRARFVDAGRSAGENDRRRLAGGDLTPRGVEGQQLRVDVQLADAAGDELAVLAAEVEDDDGVHSGGDCWIRHSPFAQCRPPLVSRSILAGQACVRPIRRPTRRSECLRGRPSQVAGALKRSIARGAVRAEVTRARSGSPASSSPAGRRAAP